MPDPQMQQQPRPGGQPPFGSSPATGPTQNQGYSAQGLAGLHMVVELLGRLIPLLGASTDAGQDALEATRKLAKHIPPGAVSPAAQQNQMQAMQMRQAQMRGMMQQQQGAAPGGAAPGGAPPGAAAPPSPMQAAA